MQKNCKDGERFLLKTSYKGPAGLVDNERRYKGYFSEGSCGGSTWVGITRFPMKKFIDNFRIVSTDYENYAIIYQCTYKTVMYNKDIITVLLRDPDFSKLQSGTEKKIRDEFDRLFGNQTQLEELEVGREQLKNQGVPDITPENKLQVLKFESHLKELSHLGCSDYPNLRLSIDQRMRREFQEKQKKRE